MPRDRCHDVARVAKTVMRAAVAIWTSTIAPSASIEWSTEWIAVLLGISVPIGWYGEDSSVEGIEQTPGTTGSQPWTLALGVSVSPF